MRARPERYGDINDADHPAPTPAKRGEYVWGEHRWQVIE
jgi:hypothetical protein